MTGVRRRGADSAGRAGSQRRDSTPADRLPARVRLENGPFDRRSGAGCVLCVIRGSLCGLTRLIFLVGLLFSELLCWKTYSFDWSVHGFSRLNSHATWGVSSRVISPPLTRYYRDPNCRRADRTQARHRGDEERRERAANRKPRLLRCAAVVSAGLPLAPAARAPSPPPPVCGSSAVACRHSAAGDAVRWPTDTLTDSGARPGLRAGPRRQRGGWTGGKWSETGPSGRRPATRERNGRVRDLPCGRRRRWRPRVKATCRGHGRGTEKAAAATGEGFPVAG